MSKVDCRYFSEVTQFIPSFSPRRNRVKIPAPNQKWRHGGKTELLHCLSRSGTAVEISNLLQAKNGWRLLMLLFVCLFVFISPDITVLVDRAQNTKLLTYLFVFMVYVLHIALI